MYSKKQSGVTNERGLAMVLAISFVAILSSIAMWMILQSKSNMQTTKAYERTEVTMRLAEGALWRMVRVIDMGVPQLPNVWWDTNATRDFGSASQQYLGNTLIAPDENITSQIETGRFFYNTVPPPGWSMAGPPGTAFGTKFYVGRGTGVKVVTAERGNARCAMSNFVARGARLP